MVTVGVNYSVKVTNHYAVRSLLTIYSLDIINLLRGCLGMGNRTGWAYMPIIYMSSDHAHYLLSIASISKKETHSLFASIHRKTSGKRQDNSEDCQSFLPEEQEIMTYGCMHNNVTSARPVSYTHLTLPTNREV